MSKHQKSKSRGNHPKASAFGESLSQDNRVNKFVLHAEAALTSNGSGNILTAVGMDPSAGGDWADFSGTFDEFRVVGCKFRLMSAQPNSTTINNGVLAIAFDNDSSVSPTTLTQVRQYNTSVTLSMLMKHDKGVPYSKTYWRPTTGVQQLWYDVANPSGSLGAILIACTGLTASTVYAYYAIDWYVEFRGRR